MTAIPLTDILFWAGSSAFTKFGTLTRRTAPVSRRGEDGIESMTRAAPNATYRNAAGLYLPAGTNKLRSQWYDLDSDGVFEIACPYVEATATNCVLQNRDCTQAVWVKTSCTASLTQTGVDGVANAASVITATGNNGSCVQTCTATSAARYQTAFIKRVTGTSTVNMTQDGSTWTPVTLSTSYSRFAISTATLANPTVGFQIAASADAIAVDYVQNEANPWGTSPIATTTASVVRAADTLSMTVQRAFPASGSLYLKIARPAWADIGGTTSLLNLVSLVASSSTGVRIIRSSANDLQARIVGPGPTVADTTGDTIPAGTSFDMVAQWAAGLTAGTVRLDAGSGFGSATSSVGALVSPITAMQIGHIGGASVGEVPLIAAIAVSGAYTLSDFRALIA